MQFALSNSYEIRFLIHEAQSTYSAYKTANKTIPEGHRIKRDASQLRVECLLSGLASVLLIFIE